MMRNSLARFLRADSRAGAAPFVCLLALLAVVGGAIVVPAPAQAADESLATMAVEDGGGVCVTGAPTFDDILTAAATALRTAVPAAQIAAFDRQVADFRGTIAAVRVHRDGLPVAPSTVNERTAFLDDPIVTYLVNGLDAVRTGRLDTTVSVSRGWTGVSDTILTPLSIAQTVAFAPTTYGAPILKGVMQSMCAV